MKTKDAQSWAYKPHMCLWQPESTPQPEKERNRAGKQGVVMWEFRCLVPWYDSVTWIAAFLLLLMTTGNNNRGGQLEVILRWCLSLPIPTSPSPPKPPTSGDLTQLRGTTCVSTLVTLTVKSQLPLICVGTQSCPRGAGRQRSRTSESCQGGSSDTAISEENLNLSIPR